MNEIRRNPKDMIRKLRGSYVDFFGRPSTEEAYLAQLSEPPAPTGKIAREISGSGIPNEQKLLDQGYRTSLTLPATQKGLTQTKGIGKKGAAEIATWVGNVWGLEIE